MDRQDGTGRGRRGDRKDGDRRGGRGNDAKPEGQADANAEESKDEKPKRERKEREPREEKKEEPVEEVEEVGFTLDDYMAAKQAKGTGQLAKKEARAHEAMDAKTAKLTKEHNLAKQEQSTTKIYTKVDTIATRPAAGSELLGFQATADAGDEFDARGKRGGRGGDRPRQDRPQQPRGRKGGKIVVDDNDFPAL